MMNPFIKLVLAASLVQSSCTSLMAAPLCIPSNGDAVDWLDKNEKAGGHTKACHVGKTEMNLLARITEDKNLGPTCLAGVEAASTFSEVSTAAKLIAATVIANKARVETWLASPRNPLPGNLGLSGRSDGSTIGLTMSKEAKKDKGTCAQARGYDCNKAKTFVIYLRRTPAPTATGTTDNECYVVTSFPD